jgi:hypothetical protein
MKRGKEKETIARKNTRKRKDKGKFQLNRKIRFIRVPVQKRYKKIRANDLR